MLFQKRGDFYLQDIDHGSMPGKHRSESRGIEATVDIYDAVCFIKGREHDLSRLCFASRCHGLT